VKDTTYKADEDGQLQAADRDKWRHDALEYMRKARMDDQELQRVEKVKRQSRLQRVAAYRHLKQIDAQLRATLAGGEGLGTFRPQTEVEKERRIPLEQLPLLVLTEDEHSVNMAAQWYLLYVKRLRMATWPDPWHRLWNDCMEGVKAAGFNLIIQLTTLCMNLPYGPWEGQKFFHEVAEAGADLLQLVDAEDPLLLDLAPQIAAELKASGDFGDGQKEWMVQQLRDASFLNKKGAHISPTRWFDWNSHFATWAEEWSLRYMCLVFLGLQVGYLQRQSAKACILALRRRLHKGSGGSKSTKQGQTEVQQVRDRCANGLHISCIIHGDKSIYHYGMMIHYSTKALTRWYSKWNAECRSRAGCLKMHVEMGLGLESFTAVGAILSWITDASAMMECGFFYEELVNSPSRFAGLTLQHDLVAQQDEHAEKLDKLQWSLVGQRVGSLNRLIRLPPRSFAMLLVSKAEAKEWALKELKRQWFAYQAAKEYTTPFWKQLVQRSPFNWELNLDVVGCLVDNKWQATPELLAWLTKVRSELGSTCPVEVAFQKNRRAESQRPDKVVGPISCWQNPVRSQLLSADFGFREVDMEAVPENPSASSSRIPATMFSSPTSRQSMNFKDIVGKGLPKHPSFSPNSSRQLVEDLQLTVYLHEHALMEEGCRAWRSKVMVPGLVVYSKTLYPGRVVSSLGAYSTCCCLWPAQRVAVGSHCNAGMFRAIELNSMADLVWAPVLDFKQWQVLGTTAISPIHMYLLNAKTMPRPALDTMRLQADRRPKPLLEVAAAKAFWRLNADLIDKLLAEEVGVTVEKGTRFPERVLLLVQKVLGCSREEGAEILEARSVSAVVADGAEELLASDECQAMMNKDEQQEMDKFLEGEAKTRAGAEDFATLVRSVRVSSASKAKKTRKPVAWPTGEREPLMRST
jgi:hypothetical protein